MQDLIHKLFAKKQNLSELDKHLKLAADQAAVLMRMEWYSEINTIREEVQSEIQRSVDSIGSVKVIIENAEKLNEIEK